MYFILDAFSTFSNKFQRLLLLIYRFSFFKKRDPRQLNNMQP